MTQATSPYLNRPLRSLAETQANARLITAAPDLLALAYQLQSAIMLGNVTFKDESIARSAEAMCRNAIAKAEGA